MKILQLVGGTTLLTQIEEIPTDLGEPDCRLVEPFQVNTKTLELSPWLLEVTTQNTFMMHSDKILTIADPNTKLKNKYEGLIKG